MANDIVVDFYERADSLRGKRNELEGILRDKPEARNTISNLLRARWIANQESERLKRALNLDTAMDENQLTQEIAEFPKWLEALLEVNKTESDLRKEVLAYYAEYLEYRKELVELKEQEKKHVKCDTLLYIDMVKSTRLSQELTTGWFAVLINDFIEISGISNASDSDATKLNTWGDGFLLAFTSASAACEFAKRVVIALLSNEKNVSHARPFAHIGIATGDYFLGIYFETWVGQGINLAARVCDASQYCQVLLDKVSVDKARSDADPKKVANFESIDMYLRDFGPQKLYSLEWWTDKTTVSCFRIACKDQDHIPVLIDIIRNNHDDLNVVNYRKGANGEVYVRHDLDIFKIQGFARRLAALFQRYLCENPALGSPDLRWSVSYGPNVKTEPNCGVPYVLSQIGTYNEIFKRVEDYSGNNNIGALITIKDEELPGGYSKRLQILDESMFLSGIGNVSLYRMDEEVLQEKSVLYFKVDGNVNWKLADIAHEKIRDRDIESNIDNDENGIDNEIYIPYDDGNVIAAMQDAKTLIKEIQKKPLKEEISVRWAVGCGLVEQDEKSTVSVPFALARMGGCKRICKGSSSSSPGVINNEGFLLALDRVPGMKCISSILVSDKSPWTRRISAMFSRRKITISEEKMAIPGIGRVLIGNIDAIGYSLHHAISRVRRKIIRKVKILKWYIVGTVILGVIIGSVWRISVRQEPLIVDPTPPPIESPGPADIRPVSTDLSLEINEIEEGIFSIKISAPDKALNIDSYEIIELPEEIKVGIFDQLDVSRYSLVSQSTTRIKVVALDENGNEVAYSEDMVIRDIE
jgi:class 3 adenylate cyclase